MTTNWTGHRTTALETVDVLAGLLRSDGTDYRRLMNAYLEAKRALAVAFGALAIERCGDSSILDEAKRRVAAEMARRYPDLPAGNLRVRGYGQVHAHLLAYLARHAGHEVGADELRLLTQDAIHTERRVRELRDLGFDVVARHAAGLDVYVLKSLDLDLPAAAACQVKKNLRENRALSLGERENLLRQAGLA